LYSVDYIIGWSAWVVGELTIESSSRFRTVAGIYLRAVFRNIDVVILPKLDSIIWHEVFSIAAVADLSVWAALPVINELRRLANRYEIID